MAEGFRVDGRFITGVNDQFRVGEVFFETPAAAGGADWTGTINGVTNPSKINGIAVSGISKINNI